ncbi:PREDICTED: phosphorylase b kinase regulatory subunit beta-like [Priapulus caudatus]|uniref:Phosphorylase b kinase regulatory subunit n=1 Tax=Priapulus caudatus TaxID=37621 RepID=A0ABM1EKC3_PRICU|nr:PREDICTED: phosphorylase b kinase regulatory subunit beta-like [Priapulus caudatus]
MISAKEAEVERQTPNRSGGRRRSIFMVTRYDTAIRPRLHSNGSVPGTPDIDSTPDVSFKNQGDKTLFFDYESTLQKLDNYYRRLKRLILRYMSPTLGLFPRVGGEHTDVVHIRDSIYCAMSVWALYQAYNRLDDDKGRIHELGQSTVKIMRGALFCWMRQADKVEQFKQNQGPHNALHSKFHYKTGDPIVGTESYGHLQIDVVALYLITLVQMISSGLQIIYTTDEANFIQNLVYYIERAYRTPDYGMWERGSRYHNGQCELHASSIGMTKAALEAINGFNVFGTYGTSSSVIYVDIDAYNRNRTIFETMLPRESSSKNFDGIECEWPMFDLFYLIDAVFRGDAKQMEFYKKRVDDVLKQTPEGDVDETADASPPPEDDDDDADPYALPEIQPDAILPMNFYVRRMDVDEARADPKGASRRSSKEWIDGKVHLMGNALYIISSLLIENLLHVNELDPVRRYLPASERPRKSIRYSFFQRLNTSGSASDLIIQVVLVAESSQLQSMLATYGIQTQTPHQIEPIQVWSAWELVKNLVSTAVHRTTWTSFRTCRRSRLSFKSFEEVTSDTGYKSLTDIPRAIRKLSMNYLSKTESWENKSTWDICQCLRTCESSQMAARLMHIVLVREGPGFYLDDGTIVDKIERLAKTAANSKNWKVVRFCYSILGKIVDSLVPSTTSVLVRGKQLVKEAFSYFQSDQSRLHPAESASNMAAFLDTSPDIVNGTTSYLAKAAVNSLLQGPLVEANVNDKPCKMM